MNKNSGIRSYYKSLLKNKKENFFLEQKIERVIDLKEEEQLKNDRKIIKEKGLINKGFSKYDERNNINNPKNRENILKTYQNNLIWKNNRKYQKENLKPYVFEINKREDNQIKKINEFSLIQKKRKNKFSINISPRIIDIFIESKKPKIFENFKTLVDNKDSYNFISKKTNKFESKKTLFSSNNSFLIQNKSKKTNFKTFISANDSFSISENKKKLSILKIDNSINISINDSILTKEESLNSSESSISCETPNIIELPNIPKGLSNFSLNCYMNSLLQCFYHIKGLRTNFIDPSNFSEDTQKVCHSLSEVMHGLTYGEKNYFSPKKFKEILGKINPLFEGCKGADVSDLYRTIIDSIINEIPYEYPEGEDDEDEGDNTNKQKYYENAKKEVDLKNPIIQDLNYFYETEYDCPEGYKCYSIQNDTSIMFELIKISKIKRSSINIYDCFEYHFRKVENNEFFCSKCECNHINTSQDKFVCLPKVLCLILNRGKGKQFVDKVEFYEKINIKKYVDDTFIRPKDRKYDYKLIGVSSHMGSSSDFGHYIAYCYRKSQDHYFCFNDESVTPVTFKEIAYDPYILFYEQINYDNDVD